MKILVVGSGGREHALCWAIRRSPLCRELLCAPGNAGIALLAELVPIAAEDIDGLVAYATVGGVDLVVIGPEVPLVLGLADRLQAAGIKAFGPSAAAAALEGSKGFMKDILAKYRVPTAAYGRFTEPEAAKAFIRATGAPIVVKTDGLAAGKGVVVATSLDEALAAVDLMMTEKAFGAAGNELVVEEFLRGEEASFFAIVDGTTALPLAAAQDHKRVGDGDTGPNTGGMGAYSPAPVLTAEICERAMREIVRPTVAAMAGRGTPFRGVLFAGLMIGGDGPKLVEFNVRFGDPEAEVILARLDDDLVEFLHGAAIGQLPAREPKFLSETALTVVVAARGYPGNVEKGAEISGLAEAAEVPGVVVLHAGTCRKGEALAADGGRVLAVTAKGADVRQARERAYAAVDRLIFPGGFFRRDIGARALARQPAVHVAK